MFKGVDWEYTMLFGKYKDMSIAELYSDDKTISYLYYLCENKIIKFEEDVHKEICNKYEEEQRYNENRM